VTDPATPADSPADGANRRALTILIGADTFTPHVNGAARFAERLAAGLVARGHDVHVLAPGKAAAPGRIRAPHGTFTEVIEGQPVTVHRIRSHRYWPHDWLTFVFPWMTKYYSRRALDAVEPDVVHIQSHINLGRGLARMAHRRGIPIIATNHVMAENVVDFTTLPPLLDKFVLKIAWDDASRTFAMTRAVTTPTRKAADFLEATIDIKNVIPVSCGIEAGNYSPDFTPRDANRIVFVGRLTTEKQIDVVLRAIKKLDPALDVTFDIIGNGDQRRNLEHLTKELGLADRVTFHGYTTDEELRATLTHASLFVIASIAELQSIATMEAMASGLPIVAANAVALPHLVHDGENGYLFDPSSVDDLAAKLTTVLTQTPEERLRMQQASREGVKVHDMQRTLDTFEALYRGEQIPE
jgi:glycosyltransferase involved in cell wall biosynthesis